MKASNFKFQIAFAFLMLILSLRFYFFYQNQQRYTDGQTVSFKTSILSQPQDVGSRRVFTANYHNEKIRIATSRFPELNYGDFVRIHGSISNKNDRLIMYFPKIEEVESPSNIFQKSLKMINNLRQKLIILFSKTLPSPSSGLLMGIIFGIKEQMPREFADNLRISGVFHVIAASGMNVTLIGGFISSFLAFFLKRQIAIALSIVGIMFYAVLAGFEASIIRASIMGILVFSAQIMGRQTLAVNGLFLAGFAMLFVDPSLISDIGFQLSFTATMGLILIRPLFKREKPVEDVGDVFRRYDIFGKSVIREDLMTTIAAQLATLPILLANFGSYSIYSILVNGLVLWTVPILMIIGAIGALMGLIIIPLGQLIIYFSYPLLLYFESIVNIFGKIGGIITIEIMPWQFIAGYYCLLSSILLVFRRSK